ncbi:MAG: von Willebrand factor type A domain-containing protein [Dysgonomonas sp.]|nr:von Willebrand factor type A domain-containing protein [Dysgonomonas sp.]
MTHKTFYRTVVLFVLLISFTFPAYAILVKGTVTDETGEPIVGCSIILQGTRRGTITDVDGNYSIEANIGDKLDFIFIGYQKETKEVKGGLLNVVLKEEAQILESVVIAYGARDYGSSFKSYDASPAPIPAKPVYFANTESYKAFTSNKFKSVDAEPLSTFSIDVDKASYSNMRRFLNQGELPPADAIRVEELINYFDYDYTAPKDDKPVNFETEVGECPWNKKNRLVKIGIKAQEIDTDDLPPANLVFLIDVSGSMYGPTRLDLVKSSMKLLVDQMRPQDRVAIVVYASGTRVVLPSTKGTDKETILDALNKLTAGGSTAGAAGIQLAYGTAEENFVKGGNNRVILCTDGDFNVGVSSLDALKTLIEEKRKAGVFLSILGYGMGNYKDDKMQTLSEAGNGNHAYIDNMQEANRVLVSEFGGTMFTVAKDVKLQIEFNPLKVKEYRLVGYESRLLEKEDFNDDLKDAGEMGVGHTVTAFYEIAPAKGKATKNKGKDKPDVDPLKYQVSTPTGSDEMLTVKLRYKDVDSDESKLMSVVVHDDGLNNVSEDFRFASAVAMFGKMLHDEEQYQPSELTKVVNIASKAYGKDEDGYRREFVRLVKLAQNIAMGRK